jgi:hypothetical protein
MNKYRARKTTIDGITFDSAGEARRWQELQLMERAGLIACLDRQLVYPISVRGQHVCDYKADFRYIDLASEKVVVEDFKGFRTAEYRLKRKLVKACHGVEIFETGAAAKPRRKPARRPLAKQEAA